MDMKRVAQPLMLCSIPALTGLMLGVLSIQWPALFLTLLVGVMLVVAVLGLRSYLSAGQIHIPGNQCHVEVGAGCILGIAFMSAFAGGLAAASNHGVFHAAFVLAVALSALAALVLTVGRDIAYGNCVWYNKLVAKLTPRDGVELREAAFRRR